MNPQLEAMYKAEYINNENEILDYEDLKNKKD